MRIEVLYFEGCPTYRTAESILRAVLACEDLQADVELVAVNTYEAANHFARRSRLYVKAVQALLLATE